jgi:hypothetical protein
MTSCFPPAKRGCGPASFEACVSLAEMVDLYLLLWGDRPARELAWWGDRSLTFDQACRRAMFMLEGEGKRDRHQRRHSAEVLASLGQRLVAHEPSLRLDRGFEGLRLAVEAAFGLLPGRSPLLVYDVTHRLSYYLGRPAEHVYLHAGPRVGAERLRPGLGRLRRLDPRDPGQLPTSLRTRLAPDQIENFLCVARRALHAGLWD